MLEAGESGKQTLILMMQIDNEGHPELNDYFVKVSFHQAFKKRHPYDFIDTYQVLRSFFGYRSHYVNFGFWDDGLSTVEPGRQLALELGKELGLSKGDRLIDIGSGLGQAAIDLYKYYNLHAVVGLNKNIRQVAFANALARSEGLDKTIYHIAGDATDDLGQFSEQGFNSLMAMECVGHLADPDRFLQTAHSILAPGGRLALSLNISTLKTSFLQHGLFKIAFGFTPATIQEWYKRIERAGYHDIRTRNITKSVLLPGLSFALRSARKQRSGVHPLVAAYIKIQFITALRSVTRGGLEYYVISASTGTIEN